MNLNQVTIPSQDVGKSIVFYQKLGLHLIVHTHDAYARFECPEGDATLSLHLVDSAPCQPGAVIYFEVEDVARRVTELQDKGIQFDSLPTEQSWLWTEARLLDPDGNQIILFYAGENRKNPPWRMGEK
ncbi:MAG: VOC family protein [Bacteroidota bacterium]